MRKLDFNNIQAKEAGEYKRLAPGAYICAITSAEDFADKEYIRLGLDIVQGEFKGYFADKFYDDKPLAHSMVLSYKDNDTVEGMLKGKLKVLTDCNPGFDAEAAWNGGDPQMFVGKYVGCTFREEEYEDRKTGDVKLGSPRPDRFVRIKDVQEGKVTEKSWKPKRLREPKPKHEVVTAADAADIDVSGIELPF